MDVSVLDSSSCALPDVCTLLVQHATADVESGNTKLASTAQTVNRVSALGPTGLVAHVLHSMLIFACVFQLIVAAKVCFEHRATCSELWRQLVSCAIRIAHSVHRKHNQHPDWPLAQQLAVVLAQLAGDEDCQQELSSVLVTAMSRPFYVEHPSGPSPVGWLECAAHVLMVITDASFSGLQQECVIELMKRSLAQTSPKVCHSGMIAGCCSVCLAASMSQYMYLAACASPLVPQLRVSHCLCCLRNYNCRLYSSFRALSISWSSST